MMSIDVTPMKNHFVATVRGIDLRRDLSDQEFEDVYQVLVDFGVIVLPEQDITIEQQLSFASRFGELEPIPNPKGERRRIDNPYIDDVSNIGLDGRIVTKTSDKSQFVAGNKFYHSDMSFFDIPCKATLLHAIEIVPEGGETEFADLVSALESLDQSTRQSLYGLIAEHSLIHSRQKAGYRPSEGDEQKYRTALQPIIRVHPDSRRGCLFVGAHAARILGMPEYESAKLLDELQQAVENSGHTYAHKWSKFDLIVWDNRRVVHRARPYRSDVHRRVMHGVRVRGDHQTVVEGKIVVGV